MILKAGLASFSAV